ncbi:MAG: hypothetical protein QXR96_03005 [Candidatus Woesearchaeota archaeon]
MIIDCKKTNSGLKLIIDEKEYDLIFPEKIWKNYPEKLKDIFSDNYAYLKVLHLPQMLSQNWKNKFYRIEKKDNNLNEEKSYSDLKNLKFKTSYPMFKQQIFNAHLNNLSFCADVDSVSTKEQLKNFLDLNVIFNDYEIKNIIDIEKEIKTDKELKKDFQEKAIVNMSFGKDSLLTFALAKELGLNPVPVFMLDNAVKLENEYKKELIKKFSKEFNTEVYTIDNQTGILHDYRTWKLPRTELGYGHLMTELLFDIMPFAYYENAKYILFGDEKSCDDTYINNEGFLSYPVYDQTSDWVKEMDNMASFIGMKVSSFIEPLYELAIIKILHNRYKEIGKYQMSCFPDENEYGKKHYWCEHCSKCARIYIFMLANNLDPKSIGFRTDMLVKENEHLFSCFGVEKKEGCSVGYDASGCGSEEQLYAFYLAYKNGFKGELIDKFKIDLLKSVEPRANELKKKYFGIHESKTIPLKFKQKLEKIFEQELKKQNF